MAISARTRQILESALADEGAAHELATSILGTPGAAIPALTVTASAGTLPATNSGLTIADAAIPTVGELLEFCVELNAKVNALRAALTAAGITA
jgi:hypothetical protein